MFILNLETGIKKINGKEISNFNDITALKLEHSLLAISEWEAKYQKPFLKDERTQEEILDYIKCMIIDKSYIPSSEVLKCFMSNDEMLKLVDYIKSTHSATTFKNNPSNKNNTGQYVTSEMVYYWMASLGLPKEYETWNFNRLMVLIRVIREEEAPKEKMTKAQERNQRAQLNALRKASMNSRG